MKFIQAYINNKPAYYGKARPGAYLIMESGVIKYVGFSTYNVIKTAYRHFQKWNDRQLRVTFPKSAKIFIFTVSTPEKAKRLEKILIKKYLPDYNTYLVPENKIDTNYPF